jgi:hypothetical protein
VTVIPITFKHYTVDAGKNYCLSRGNNRYSSDLLSSPEIESGNRRRDLNGARTKDCVSKTNLGLGGVPTGVKKNPTTIASPQLSELPLSALFIV